MTYYGAEGGSIETILGLLIVIIVVASISFIGSIINDIIKKFKGDK